MDRMHTAVEEVFRNRNSFILIGLTGRSGSGCSTAAEFLSSDFEKLELPKVCLSKDSKDHDRKRFIIYNFAKRNWKSFFRIKVSDIITSFILDNTYEDFSNYIMREFQKDISELRADYEIFYARNKCLEALISASPNAANKEEIYDYITNGDGISEFSKKFKAFLVNNSQDDYTSVYQQIGNNIRKFNRAIPGSAIDVENIYALANRINRLIKVLRKHNKRNNRNSYFVIDAFRNPFEAQFFQERYSAFYLMAVRCPEEDRTDRLINLYNFQKIKINSIDDRENPRKSTLKNIDTFLSQDIATCIQLADIHIDNSGLHKNTNFNDLKEQLARYVSLIQHPALINPSRDEKMMQVAFTAKLNSGCLSRKVGAVVTNAAGVPKAIGWNSSPEGQTSCLLRNAHIMTSNTDVNAYSLYEQTDTSIISIAKQYTEAFDEHVSESGINCSFCFKDFQNKKDGSGNQVHNRALHAEENAFLQIAKFGGEGVVGGKLYTTAAPCDLCSRKSFQLGIKEIFYIDPYPGIAVDHVLMVGSEPPKLILFRGAIGSAYHKLYSAILPYKDELYSYLTKDFFKKTKEGHSGS